MNQQVLGVVLGGSLIAALGSISTYTFEKKEPTIKSVSRDFIIGGILFMFIMYLLPESSMTLLNMITSLSIFSLPTLSTLPVTTAQDELEINVGVPKF
uniref:Uncharacterized protein n=1 Tax=viral metagenome TaxID=1070528 RepID=A0A6C0IFQ8_9ZZZZ